MNKDASNAVSDTTTPRETGVRRALVRASGMFHNAGHWCDDASRGCVRLHVGNVHIWTTPALERYGRAHHRRGANGFPEPAVSSEPTPVRLHAV